VTRVIARSDSDEAIRAAPQTGLLRCARNDDKWAAGSRKKSAFARKA
jgi:hypothetical protein